ncbi:DUF4435 domain-containing protein [Shewanella algae]|uniref:DUF4435 domain-containing protein n=1 Tax=Shewanella algae TaxID=38313 RepID=A0AAD1K7B8_9GAMM|nr:MULTISPECIES: DUF4435 domain-containing protein [Shewanella]MBO2594381.1 DUF4435 domain-containing protein [Shewanella algae]MBO2665738.1 DUF4435 domain-containing protein [Shewanella algae]BCV44151.1 hypothetical protein TUM17379_11690 [Shewanella algae]
MAELEYSIDARNILNQFYGVENIVYVEGEDDIAFWEYLFEKLSDIKIKAEEVGGKDKLQARIEEIKEGSASFLVAMDSDFDWLLEVESHPQIFSTFGYSMENTMISDSSLQRFISRVAKVSKHQVEKGKCQEWLSDIEVGVLSLVLADAVNRQEGLGLAVVSNNCDRFLVSKNSCNLSSQKITSHLETLGINVEDEFRGYFRERMDARGLSVIDVLRGHFLISAVFRFVKDYVTELKTAISISREMLFGGLMLAFEASFDENHQHYEYYRSILSPN